MGLSALRFVYRPFAQLGCDLTCKMRKSKLKVYDELVNSMRQAELIT